MLNLKANDFQYFFLGGIMGEVLELPMVGNYLKENERILREMGIQDIQCLTLSSLNSAHRNAKKLVEILKLEFERREKKIIIFSHSKACLEVLIALLREYDFFDKAVERIICVQPPFQGSEVLNTSIFQPLLKAWPGLNSLRKDFYTDLFQEELIEKEDRHKFLKEKLLVIRTFMPRSRDVSWVIRPIHFIFKRTGSQSDGLLKLSEQVLPFAQYTDIMLEMDHSDLFTSHRLSNQDCEFRKNLMVNLINMSIERNENVEVNDSSFSFEDVIPTRFNNPEISYVF
jgi:hypothetical protein